MVGRRTWHGTSGRPRKDLADADQLDLPIQPRNRGLSLVFYVALTWVARTAETKGKTWVTWQWLPTVREPRKREALPSKA